MAGRKAAAGSLFGGSAIAGVAVLGASEAGGGEGTACVSAGAGDTAGGAGARLPPAGLTVVDSATAEMCGQVIYPAAVLNVSAHPEAAQAFLDFLSTEAAMAVFENVGFAPVA